jgi:hypothetical protein
MSTIFERLDRRLGILQREIDASRQPVPPTNGLTVAEDELPEGVDEDKNTGGYTFRCRGCDKWHPMEWDLSDDSYESHYCGGSPRCCP